MANKEIKVVPMIAALCLAGFTAAYSESLMNVALPGIMSDFGVDSVTVQWLATGYLIVGAIMVMVTAFLLRRLSLRRLFVIASCLFIGGAVVAALAPNYPILLVFRLIQACGTGVFIALMTSTILVIAPKDRTASYMAIGGACIAMGPALAPLGSGVMVTIMSWRGVFIPPLVIMVVAAVLGLIFVRNIEETQKVTLDVPSLILAIVGLVLFMYGIADILAKPLVCGACIVVGIIVLVVFYLRQKKLASPLLNVFPLGKGRYVVGCIIAMLAMMIPFANSICGPMYYENSLHFSTLSVGFIFLAAAVACSVASIPAGRIMDKHGEWPLIPCGVLMMVVGIVMVIVGIEADMIWLAVIGGMFISAGSGFSFMTSQNAALKNLPDEMNADGVSIVNTFIQIAACLGGTLYVGIMSSTAAMFTGISDVAAQCNGFAISMAVALVLAVIVLGVSIWFARSNSKQ